jgi:hypothetical protein
MQPSMEELAARHRALADKLAEPASRTGSDSDADAKARRRAFPSLTPDRTRAILQPPPPEITPSPHILNRAAKQERNWEAAD